MTTKKTIYLGLNDQATKTQVINTIEAYKIVNNLISNDFSGGTIFEAQGIYKHADGTIVIERTLRIELLLFEAGDAAKVSNLIQTLKKVFNQESVAVQTENITSELI